MDLWISGISVVILFVKKKKKTNIIVQLTVVRLMTQLHAICHAKIIIPPAVRKNVLLKEIAAVIV